MDNYDICNKYKLTMQYFSVSLSDNTTTTLPTGIVSAKKYPLGAVIVDAIYPSTAGIQDRLISLLFEYDATTLAPKVTPQFSNDVTGVMCTVAVFYNE